MKWEKVRRLYPDQYVKLEILDFYLEDDKKIVTDVVEEIGIYFEK